MENHDGHQFDPQSPFWCWDWGLLFTYEGRGSPSTELQLLSGVRTHVLTAYEALIVSQTKSSSTRSEGSHAKFSYYPSSSNLGSGLFSLCGSN
ncbi:hypothetical protein EDB80DRAFT_710097 [Ilyonectria destructans]|nr:hypothetical protein EDB80DRAFT_710097 [Ilyonectria destructans]